MKVYIKPSLNEVSMRYRCLAEKMWFKEKSNKHLEISHVGNDESLQKNLYLTLKLDKSLNDIRWKMISFPLKKEYIEMEKNMDDGIIIIETTHANVLSVDKRAFYIMTIEITEELEGVISEDNLKTWISVDKFKSNHQDILSLSYDEVNEISLKEVETVEVIDEI